MKILEFTNIGEGITDIQYNVIQNFIMQNSDSKINLRYEAINNALHWQHKYYRGYLLPSLVDAMGDKNAHFELKKMFLKFDIYSLDSIPKHHASKCNIFLDMDNIPRCYMPSTSVLTFEEFGEFISKCHILLTVDLSRGILPHLDKQAQKIREMF